MPPPPGCGVVELPDGDRASGLASMIADLLEANRRDFRLRRWVAGRLRGPVVFTASDRDVSVTLWFDRGAVTVVDGAAVGAPSVAGPWLTMTRVCSGRCSPARAWRDGELALAGSGGARAAAAAFVLSVPSSFYRPPSADPTVRRLARATLAATLALVAVGGFTRGSGSGYGCEDRWPLCEQGLLGGLLPRPEATMVVEWSHRWLAATVGVLAVVTAVLAWRRRRAPGVVGPAVVAVGVIGAQAWVGRLVVARDLDGDLVALHLAISMVVVALVTVVVMMAGPPPEPAPSGGPAAAGRSPSAQWPRCPSGCSCWARRSTTATSLAGPSWGPPPWEGPRGPCTSCTGRWPGPGCWGFWRCSSPPGEGPSRVRSVASSSAPRWRTAATSSWDWPTSSPRCVPASW